jgi:hypothetical protein
MLKKGDPPSQQVESPNRKFLEKVITQIEPCPRLCKLN